MPVHEVAIKKDEKKAVKKSDKTEEKKSPSNSSHETLKKNAGRVHR